MNTSCHDFTVFGVVTPQLKMLGWRDEERWSRQAESWDNGVAPTAPRADGVDFMVELL